MRSTYLMPASIATLLALAACSQGPWGSSAKASAASAHSAGASAKADTPAPTKAQPVPTPDEELALTLDHLGAKRGSRGETLTLADDEFTSDHSKLQAPAADELKQLVKALRDYPKADVIVDGYTDSRGNEHRNERLSLARADVVKQALITDGMDGSRIRAQGLGPADPVGDNKTKAGREENRRVEVVFSNSEGQFAPTKDQSKTG
jgi:outer membrane protein OmpA-like peptidoglycan-associated protein